MLWGGDTDAVVDEIEEFLTGVRPGPEPDRVLATVLFTDIVGSTERAASSATAAGASCSSGITSVVRRELERFRGREVDTAGDGFLATFDGPARAIRCARAIRDARRRRSASRSAPALHTGECELRGEKVRGHRGAHRRARRGAGRAGRGARLEHGEGPRRRLGHRVRGPRASTS